MEEKDHSLPAYSIKDKDFDIHNLSSYFLILKIHKASLGISVFDTNEGRCLVYEHYLYEPFSGATSALVRLQNIWNQHHFLKAAYWKKIMVINADANFVFVPDAFLPDNGAIDYLRLNCKFDVQKSHIYSHHHKSLASSCHYLVYKELQQWLAEQYSSCEIAYLHFSSAFLKGISSLAKVADPQTVFLLLHGDILLCVYLKAGKLQLINSFKVQNAQDFLYYTMFILDELKISPKRANLTLWGDMSEKSDYMTLAKDYVPGISLGKRPMHLKFSFLFDELPDQFEFDLFSVYDIAK